MRLTRSLTLLCVISAILATSTLRAEAPKIDSISPLGIRRGEVTEIQVNGARLGTDPKWIAPFAGTVESVKAEAGKFTFKLNVGPDVPLGIYPIRVRTADGLSNPFLFAIGQVEQVQEKEDNSTFETAQTVPSPAVIEGQVAGNDVDYFKFPGKKGQRIVVDAQCARIGSGVDPSIRLTTSARAYVASADDTPGLLTDARLVTVLPEDTDYVIELSDSRYQGSNRPVYRLLIGAIPIAEEVYPQGGRLGETLGVELRGGTLDGMATAATALNPPTGSSQVRIRAVGFGNLDIESLPPLVVENLPELREPTDPDAPPLRAVPPVIFNGRIDPKGDEDRFTLVVVPGQKLRIDVTAADLGSSIDGTLQILGAKDAVLATADDTTANPAGPKNRRVPTIVSPDPALDFTVPADTTEITLALRDLQNRGGIGYPYRIRVEPSGSGFELSTADAQVSIPKGGVVAIPVAVIRSGYTGPITLNVINPPAGLTVRPGTINEGQLQGVFTVSATEAADFGPLILNVIGEGGTFKKSASKTVIFSQQATLPTNSMDQQGLFAVTALAQPANLDAPATPIEVPHGAGGTFVVTAKRGEDANGPLAIAPLPLVPGQVLLAGLTAPAVTMAEKINEATITVNAAPEVPLGLMTVAFTAKGKLANEDRTLYIPAITLNIVRPVTIEVAIATIDIKPGQTLDVKGKITRKGTYKEPVTIKIDGLPAGTKADAVTLKPEEIEFTLKLIADENATPGMAAAKVLPAIQINKKDYAVPPIELTVKVVPK